MLHLWLLTRSRPGLVRNGSTCGKACRGVLGGLEAKSKTVKKASRRVEHFLLLGNCCIYNISEEDIPDPDGKTPKC